MQICGCAALCAAGAAMGGVRVLGELALQLPGSRAAPTLAALAGGGGVLLGLWLPRRVLRRRLAGGAATAGRESAFPPVPPDPVELEFAASVVGGLAVTAAVLWVLLCLGATSAEDWRAWLAAQFLFPPPVTRALVIGPPLLIGVGTTVTGTLLLIGLHGWWRLAATRAETGVTLFWGAIASGAGVGGFAAAGGPPTPLLDVLTVLLTLAGGIIAVGRPLRGLGSPEPEPERHPRSRVLAGTLAAPLVAAAGLGVMISAVWAAVAPDARPLGSMVGWLAVGSLAGIALAAWPRLGGATAWVPLLAAAVFAVSGFQRGPAADAVRALASGAAFAIVAFSAARRTLSEVRRSQAVLGLLSSATVAGGVVGVLAGSLVVPRATAAAGLLLVGAAWLHQRADGVAHAAGRRLGFALIVVAVLTLVPESVGPAAKAGVDHGVGEIVGRLAAAAGGDPAVLVLASPETLRDADLGGPRADVVIADVSRLGATARSAVARVMRRLPAALRPGGVLVLVGRSVEPSGLSAEEDPASPLARVRSYRTAAGAEVVVAGGALPARLAAVLEAEARD